MPQRNPKPCTLPAYILGYATHTPCRLEMLCPRSLCLCMLISPLVITASHTPPTRMTLCVLDASAHARTWKEQKEEEDLHWVPATRRLLQGLLEDDDHTESATQLQPLHVKFYHMPVSSCDLQMFDTSASTV